MPKTAALVVVGDVGHSPRMNYHALSLAEHGLNVEIIGYMDSKPHQKIREHPRIRVIPLKPPPKWLANVKPTVALGLKVLWTAFFLSWALMFQTTWNLSMVMMQNPPGIPALMISWLISKLKRASFVIDWHNYTWSILRSNYKITLESLTLPRKDEAHTAKGTSSSSVIQRYIQLAYNWEGRMGRAADVNICVSNEMKKDLAGAWGVNAVTLYDKAPAWNFKELSVEEKHVFFQKLITSDEFNVFRAEGDVQEDLEDAKEVTRFSYRDADGVAHLRESRPLILLSSTSWTDDEDFGILLNALKAVDSNISASSAPLPHFCVIITGKGPQKAMYLDKIAEINFRHIDFITPWLEAEDYPKMLAVADIGVSLHTSTSGIDLPMKVVDIFGCKLPVLAKSFRAIGELVIDGGKSPNGRLFDNNDELKAHILDLANGFPLKSEKLDDLRANLRKDYSTYWSDHWDEVLTPVLNV
ncbi:hypothetical protein QR680_014680 [Steinernema hermaphroditum]|uniref:Glycosyltransferase subfamily 4-like N-terminal domain-containing protein n=1 Tax=Steinernema hermaphroditum TaxID=289476 RepID=A0AA39IBE5_9BILA|nr:hypothetical protein QR680_014680 [Steinernema hermaphroditum]